MKMQKTHNFFPGLSRASLVLLSIILICPAMAQRNIVIPDSISRNFHKEAQLRERYWDTIGVNKRKGEYKHYNRWRYFWEQRVGTNGLYPTSSQIYNAYQQGMADIKRMKGDKFQAMPQWEDVGSRKNPTGDAIKGGVGRINAVRANPANHAELWAGAANGGVWRSTVAGTWTPLYQTEFLSMGVSDIAFATSNPSVVYVATGDFDGSLTNNSCYSIGIIKTTDGGGSWAPTQNQYTLDANRLISRLWVHPENENIVVAATANGIIRSADGGQTWDSPNTDGRRFADLEQKPGDPNTLYASTSQPNGATASSITYVYKSTDAGETWEVIRNITSGGKRTCLAVTPAAPNAIYVLTANYLNGFHSLIVSEDGGENWNLTNVYETKRQNYLQWSSRENKTDGQGHYDLALAVSPTDANVIFLGGVNIHRSTDKGANFTMVAHWAAEMNIPYVHADIHDLNYIGDTLYVGHDGGIDYTATSGSSWVQRYEGMGINQIYAINTSKQDPRKVIIGMQDLGTIRRDETGEWFVVSGGDGMQCYFDPADDRRFYSSVYNGSIYRVEPDGDPMKPVLIIDPNRIGNLFDQNDTGAWVTAFAISPQNPSKIYMGYCNMYFHPDYGKNAQLWVKQTNNNYNSSNTIRHIRIYPTNDSIVYASTLSSIIRTTNGGEMWLNMPMPPNVSINNIALHPTNPNVLYLVASGYTDGAKLYKYDGGAWTNISGNLPNVPATCVSVQADGDATKLYIGTDIGVYYGLEGSGHFVKWGVGLPSLIISQIELFPEDNKLRAATYGRGIWETSLNPCAHSTMEIQADGELEFCVGDSVRLFVDPNAEDVLWSTGDTTNEIWVKTPGTFSAVVNSESDCYTYSSNKLTTTTKAIRRLDAEAYGSTAICIGDSVELVVTSTGFADVKWSDGQIGESVWVKEPGTYIATATNTNGCFSYSEPIDVTTHERPGTTAITHIEVEADGGPNKVDTLEAVEEAGAYQWYRNGSAVPGANSKRITVNRTEANEGSWTVALGVAGTGCFGPQSEPAFVNDIREEQIVSFSITPNPATAEISLLLDATKWGRYTVSILNVQGQVVQQHDNFDISSAAVPVDISALAAGSYVVRISNNNVTYSATIIKSSDK